MPVPIERANALLRYDEPTGELVWLVNRRGPGARAGMRAGYSRPDGYVSIKIDGVKEYAHRLIWRMAVGQIPDGMEIDHIDHCPANNRLVNLRLVSSQGNRMNSSTGRRNMSGAIGVHWSPNAKKWCAQIRKNKKTHHLGYFDSLDQARRCRELAQEQFGFHENHGKEIA